MLVQTSCTSLDNLVGNCSKESTFTTWLGHDAISRSSLSSVKPTPTENMLIPSFASCATNLVASLSPENPLEVTTSTFGIPLRPSFSSAQNVYWGLRWNNIKIYWYKDITLSTKNQKISCNMVYVCLPTFIQYMYNNKKDSTLS